MKNARWIVLLYGWALVGGAAHTQTIGAPAAAADSVMPQCSASASSQSGSEALFVANLKVFGLAKPLAMQKIWRDQFLVAEKTYYLICAANVKWPTIGARC